MASGEPPPGRGEPERFEPRVIADLPSELALSRLPAGRHGLPRSFVVRNQRLRLIAAMLQALPGAGSLGTTIGDVTREAGVSRAAFYEQFASKEECFLATYDLAAEWFCERIERAADESEEWPSQVRAGVSEALRLLADNPALAHLFAIEALRVGPAARDRQQACLSHFAAALRLARPADKRLPAELEEMLLGGVLTTIGRYVDAGRTEQLPEAAAELVQYLLLPYLEPEESRRIAVQVA